MAKATGERIITVRMPAELLTGLRQLFERDGIGQSEAIRRAVRMLLDAKGIKIRRKP